MSDVTAFEVGARVTRQAQIQAYEREAGAPLSRPLRIYALDPSVSDRSGGVATVEVPYEKLSPGPVGSLFEINWENAPEDLATVEALNLDDPYLLLSSGLSPTPAKGQFHLQMAYAVCSVTYAAFSRALGREIAWAAESPFPEPPGSSVVRPRRLLVRAFVEGRNAGYSRETGDLSFGWFRAEGGRAGFTLENGVVSTALSHDVIAHETAHALLDGLRSSFMNPTNVDVPAFHEGFADLIALFLHFTYADVVERAIRESEGPFARGSLLTDIAREFGYARSKSGHARALRSGVDVEGLAAFDSDLLPSNDSGPKGYDAKLDPHDLGSVLVSAVFEAFTTIVRRKTERLFGIAGLGAAQFARATANESLVKAVAQEACEVASQFLTICIRAIDYCPTTDMELGEYLRALITADGDMERTDKWGYREALMRSFRRRDIFPDHVPFMTEDAVRWQSPGEDLRVPALAFSRMKFNGDPGRPASEKELIRQAEALGKFVTDRANADAFHLIVPGEELPRGVTQASPASVDSIRVARHASRSGRIVFDLVAEVTQSCTVRVQGDLFDMAGGCTIVIDPEGRVRYAIYKKFSSKDRRARQYAAMRGPLKGLWKKSGRRYRPRTGMLRLVHARGNPG